MTATSYSYYPCSDIATSGALTHRYYVQDYLGSKRAVVDEDGNVLQSTAYYPSGVPLTPNSLAPQTIKLHTGKDFFDLQGAGWYDNNARYYDPILARFTTLDPLAEKYPGLSPYVHCANNPLKYIDPNGDSIAVLNKGTGNNQHIGLLIQNKDSKWDYYSVNGNNMYFFGSGSSSGSSNGSSFFVGGKTTNDLGEKSYNSPVEYLNSSDNKSEYSYKNAYVIPTSQKQDDIVKQTFITESNKNYNLATQNCATAVEKSLSEANLNADFRIDKSINVPIINNQIRVSITTFPIPSILYDYIKTNNPGYEINQ